MSELRIDVSELKRESEDLIKELAVFLEEKTKAKVETTENEIIVKGEAASKKWVLRTLAKVEQDKLAKSEARRLSF